MAPSPLGAMLARVQAALPGNFVPVLATVVVGLLTLVLIAHVVEDHMSKGGTDTFYPSVANTRVLSYKLLTGALSKGSKWKKDVQKENFHLCDRVLSAQLSLLPHTEHVADMIRVCELPSSAPSPRVHLPFVYPAVLMVYPNCLLFTKPEYPFPAIGSVHVLNRTVIHRPLSVEEEYAALLKVDPVVKPAKKGTEVTFISTLRDKTGAVVWSNASTFLVLHKRLQTMTPTVKPDRELQPPTTTAPVKNTTWSLPANMGRQYAAVAKDNNPIHTSALAAKAFGFPGVIMHGMYFIVRAAAECQAVVEKSDGLGKLGYPVEVTAKFVRPVVLPHKVGFKVTPIVATEGSKGGSGAAPRALRYEVLNKAGKIAVEGEFSYRG